MPPASRGQRRFAAAAIIASTVAFGMAAPFARHALTPVPAFIPVYETALSANDLITAALLFGQFGFFGSRRLLTLAGGYLFTGLLAIAHALTFPGLFAPSGLLGAGPQTTAWLYMFWHAGFPLFVIAYARSDERPMQGGALRAVLVRVGWVIAASASLTLLATAGQRLLPPIMSGNHYTAAMAVIVGAVWLSSVVGLALLRPRKPYTVLDLWLVVVLWAWVLDVALSAVLNGGRFDLGFYAGRVYGLVAASVVLVAMLVENAKLYHRLGERTRELERAKEAALEAKAAKGAFLAAMSHEIRTPLNGLMGLLELLALTRLDGEQRTTVAIVRESGRSLQRIVDDILDFSKIAAGKLELRPEPASIARVVERVANTYSGNASSKGLSLRRAVDERIAPALLFDAVRVQQILNNLVSNAIKFTASGEVAIAADLVETNEAWQVVRVAVSDTGTGIPSGEAKRLFTPFTQGANALPGGTGLGLAISRRLAEQMGGGLAMESEVGEGTVVSLTLRLAVADAALLPKESAPRPTEADLPSAPHRIASSGEARATGSLVLVVDDHPINRMLLVKQITALGCAVESARDGAEALALYEVGGVGLIFTDCNMPVMDGYQMTQAIRAREAESGRPRLPVIACTANALAGEAARCFAAGMDDYLAKPVTLEQLRVKLGQWLPAARGERSAPSPIDRAVLGEFSGGDALAEREILAQFWRHHRSDEQALRAALAAKDADAVVQAAHRIRGAGAAIGARGLADVCGRIERTGRARDWTALEACVGDFDAESRRLSQHIERAET